MRLGELFAGYGGLGMAVAEVFGAELAWVSEIEDAPSRILAHHWPDVPNHGDLTRIDWTAVEPVDIISGGFPCQDLSLAGKRRGMKTGTRSGLWANMFDAIETIRPRYVVAENVRGLLSGEAHSDMEPCPWCMGDADGEPNMRALGAVLADLADIGYDAQWCGLRAADVGAPHGRYRVFVLAEDTHRAARSERREPTPGQEESRRPRPDAGRRTGTPAPADAGRLGLETGRLPGRPGAQESEHNDRLGVFREYAAAVSRWELITRPAPVPTKLRPNGRATLNVPFVEWMMGLPDGWVTDPDIGLTRGDQLKALGNGVVPQQAAAALHHLKALADGR